MDRIEKIIKIKIPTDVRSKISKISGHSLRSPFVFKAGGTKESVVDIIDFSTDECIRKLEYSVIRSFENKNDNFDHRGYIPLATENGDCLMYDLKSKKLKFYIHDSMKGKKPLSVDKNLDELVSAINSVNKEVLNLSLKLLKEALSVYKN